MSQGAFLQIDDMVNRHIDVAQRAAYTEPKDKHKDDNTIDQRPRQENSNFFYFFSCPLPQSFCDSFCVKEIINMSRGYILKRRGHACITDLIPFSGFNAVLRLCRN